VRSLVRFFLGRPPRCGVHDVPLLRGEVPVRHGLVRLSEAHIRAMRQKFPHAHSFAASCFSVGGEAETRIVDFCPQCRTFERAWLESQ